ncbi:aldo/keto reductase [Streptacidiphilus albus]|uniref:aldo/keto reductase n=1 Tax=Streptacidiphilus albus TaxID=105425 RepID=UPI00054B9D67|nr:aldo/keto reductase [Streptacidiphilus albus]
MEYRRLGNSGLHVPLLSFGAGTFGGRGSLFSAWGDTGLKEARNLVDLCLDAGVTMFDTADVYSEGFSEELLGAAVAGRRDKVLLSTKAGTATGPDPWQMGTGRSRLIRSVEGSLRRLGVEHIDLFQLHAFDAGTPVDEVLAALHDLVRAGKIRYVGASNFAGWQLMKSLAAADRSGFPRYVAHQVYYSLAGRDYEWELMPLAHDQGVGAVVWSPLGWGRLTGKVRRGQPLPASSRLHRTASAAPPIDDERLYDLVDVLVDVAAETGRTVPQVALNWLLTRPTVATVIIGARNEEQLRDNLGAVGWQLESEQLARLDKVSEVTPPYPYQMYYRLRGFTPLNPPLV